MLTVNPLGVLPISGIKLNAIAPEDSAGKVRESLAQPGGTRWLLLARLARGPLLPHP